MTEALYDRMNWADIEEITYAEASHPKRILGPHKMEDGWLIQAYVPTAVEMFILIGKKTIPMELADESGFFAGFLPFRIAGKGTLITVTISPLTTAPPRSWAIPMPFRPSIPMRISGNIRPGSFMMSTTRWVHIRIPSMACPVSASPSGRRMPSVSLSSVISISGMAAVI